MTALDHAALRALAEQRQSADRCVEIECLSLGQPRCSSCLCKREGDAITRDYIAAANPAAMLALLDENARMRDLLGRVLASLETHIPYAPWHMRQALDDDGNLIVDEGSLVAEARAALGKEPRA